MLDSGRSLVRVLMVVGTRPEIIKMGPVYQALKRTSGVQLDLFWSGQHLELAEGLLELFDMEVTFDARSVNETGLVAKMSNIMSYIAGLLKEKNYDWILVQGDTTTAAAAGVGGFLSNVRVAHVEAGLRTGDLRSPWPEEYNRRLVGLSSTFHFAPTEAAKDNLLREGVARSQILVTGNTVVDALQFVRNTASKTFVPKSQTLREIELREKLILVTGHRRENFGPPMRRVLSALKQIAEDPNVSIVFPVHLNPSVHKTVYQQLGDHDNIHLTEPLQYSDLVQLLSEAWVIITDSGGIQEEAPTFKKPIIITREVTERPEVVEAGFGLLAGTETHKIVKHARRMIAGSAPILIDAPNPFGDGEAAKRIASVLQPDVTAREEFSYREPEYIGKEVWV